MSSLVMKTKVFSGVDAFSHLGEYQMKNACIITDPFVVSSGMIRYLTDELDKIGVQYAVFSDVVTDPPLEVIIDGVVKVLQQNPDAIISVGGGSAIDTAKAISYFGMQIKKQAKPLFVAVPTTSGTGSEVTAFAVVSDKTKNVKYPLVDEWMQPDVALLDPRLTLSVPPSVTADTGMDVLTHAIEAYVSTQANDFSDTLAEKAVKLIFTYLPRACEDGKDLEAREKLHNASCMAGMAFNNVGLGINHSIAHALGANFHLPHGRANAILLPYVAAFNTGLLVASSENFYRPLRKYAQLAQLLGIEGGTERSSVRNLLAAIADLSKTLGIPQSVKEQGVEFSVFSQRKEDMITTALADACTPTNPRIPTRDTMGELMDACYGNSVH